MLPAPENSLASRDQTGPTGRRGAARRGGAQLHEQAANKQDWWTDKMKAEAQQYQHHHHRHHQRRRGVASGMNKVVCRSLAGSNADKQQPRRSAGLVRNIRITFSEPNWVTAIVDESSSSASCRRRRLTSCLVALSAAAVSNFSFEAT